jgi:RNA recognition motif-containing protein
MLTMVVRGLPKSMTQITLEHLFTAHGRVFDVRMSKDLFSGECKGFAQLKMEGHQARAAIAALDGTAQEGSYMRVSLLDETKKRRSGRQ